MPKFYKNRIELLNVWEIISSLFQFILRFHSKLTLDAIDKNLEVPKVFLEKSFEVRPCDESIVFIAMLMLNSSKANSATMVRNGKIGIIHLGDV